MMNNHNRSFHHSNESQTQKISSSVYVTNFPDSTTSRDLWKACSDYGTVVDVFIPFEKSKAGKKFAFVRFIKVINLERLMENLNTAWIGRFHLFANRVWFERPAKPIFVRIQKPSSKPHISKSAAPLNSFTSVLKEGHVSVNNSEPVIVLDESCMKVHDFNLSLMGKVKNVSTISNLPVLIANEGFQNADNAFVNDERIVWVSVEGLPIKAWTPNSFKKITSCWGELMEWDDSGHNSFSCKHLCLKTRMNVVINDKHKLIVQGKAFWIRVKELDAWFPDFEEDNDDDVSSDEEEPKGNNSQNFDASSDDESLVVVKNKTVDLQNEGDNLVEDTDDDAISETIFGDKTAPSSACNSSVKVADYQSKDPFDICPLLNKNSKGVTVDLDSSLSHPPGFTSEGSLESVANSGGILCVWEANVFHKDYVSVSDNFIAVYGTWTPSKSKVLMIAIYAPQSPILKRVIWDYISSLITRWNGETVVMGDFNEVRLVDERLGSTLNQSSVRSFNNFISSSGLMEFRWKGIILLFPSITTLCLARHLSDHRPILLNEIQTDYGPVSFWIFHSWFKQVGFDTMVENAWNSFSHSDSNSLIRFKKKLQDLKKIIRCWIKDKKSQQDGALNTIKEELIRIDKNLDSGLVSDETLLNRRELVHKLHVFKKLEVNDFAQKAKIKWAVEGDENSKFFHGIINKKRSQLSILWDCGENKSPGPDGYTFEFFRRYWNFIGPDFCSVVECFFGSGCFPKGSNASFIALIPKVADVKFVTDFRPISLIESVYKVVTKILSNRLTTVILDLVFDSQSAFIANRQILYGPFILNELLSWCKRKNKQALIFKVDFAKAYDSVRWDYLLDVLPAFGFGPNWCKWIRGTFSSAMASISVNGSPTSEFLFFCELKHGDPLAPFLFILIMESLHISFSRAVSDGFFKWIIFKSQVLGVGVPRNIVHQGASLVGCAVMQTPFRYLGVSVGERMSRKSAWRGKLLGLCGKEFWRPRKTVDSVCPVFIRGIEPHFSSRCGGLSRKMGPSGLVSLVLCFDFVSRCKKRVGDGCNTWFWLDTWVLDCPLSVRFPRIFALEKDKAVFVSVKLGAISIDDSFRRPIWDGVEQQQWVELSSILDDLFLPSSVVATRWVKYIPIKINIFTWRARLDRLLTRYNLAKRWVNILFVRFVDRFQRIPSISCSNESVYLCRGSSEAFGVIR
nr:RNA-directed DNA polymerase, eukaryota [Tanacetum cinerariifolium]